MLFSFSRHIVLTALIIVSGFLVFTYRDVVIPGLSYPFIWGSYMLVKPFSGMYQVYQGVHYFRNIAQQLLEERDTLLRELIVLKGTRDYLDDSRECAEFKKRYDPAVTLTTQIILKHFSDQGNYYYIDAGNNRGIQKDMVVIYDNCLVGRITEVHQWYSRVLLVTDKECHVAVRCAETGTCGIHSGCNSDTTLMEYVNHLDKINEHDLVVSHGEGLIFPRGFAVGRVQSYKLDGVHYKVNIKPLIDLRKLTHCLVLLKY